MKTQVALHARASRNAADPVVATNTLLTNDAVFQQAVLDQARIHELFFQPGQTGWVTETK